MSHRVGSVLMISPLLAIACSAANSAVTNPCSLLTREDVAREVGGDAAVGQRVQAIGEREQRLCTYRVSTALGTVLVYLGQGRPPHGAGVDASGATEVRGHNYVSIGAQNPNDTFPPIALRLAQQAIKRADGR